LDSKNNETIAHLVRWTKEEDSTLKDAVDMYNGKNWAAIAALVPGRTKSQCRGRWYCALEPKSHATAARKGKWTKEEDVELKDIVEKHNGKKWVATAALLPGRTNQQFMHRWHRALVCKNDETTAHAGTWTQKKKTAR
jgi:myb proto-oncogene protein